MKYRFKKVSCEEIDQFAVSNGIFRQTSIWFKMKKRYFKNLSFIGYDENNNIVFSCLLLRFYIPFTVYSVCYAPRGFICDYSNTLLIKDFTEFYNKYMKKNHILYTTFDPEIVKTKDFKEYEEGYKIHNELLKMGYLYNDTNNHHGHMQNNNDYRLLIDYNSDNVEETTFKSFVKKLQYDINLCQIRGVTFEKFDGSYYTKHDEIFERFYELVIETSKRKGFTEKLLSKEKYKKIIYSLSKYGYIYLAKYNYEIDYKNTNDLIIKTKEEISNLENLNTHKSINKIKELQENILSYEKRLNDIENNKDNPYIATSFFIVIGNQTYYMFGANESKLRFAKPTSLLVWEMIKETIKNGSKVFNTGGSLAFDSDKIEDDSMYSVYDFKRGMNGELVDFFGDYYLINNKKYYDLLEKKLRLLKRINNRY
jgi:peptidoglycan pentaglycine glycine transferase (the first glycine)